MLTEMILNGLPENKLPESEDATAEDDPEKDEISNRFIKHWIEFMKHRTDAHPYSTESHGIIRCGKGVDASPNLNKEIYNEHVENHGRQVLPIPEACLAYLNGVIDSKTLKDFRKALSSYPEANDDEERTLQFLEEILRACLKFYSTRLNIEDGEAVFDSLFIYPFVKAVADAIADESADSGADFRPGEAVLKSMSNQLKKSDIFKNDRCSYLADGIVKLYGLKEIEILLLETSWHFNCTDKSKHSFDHHKGVFGSLAMLKNIADDFRRPAYVFNS
ncbi:hypothetical protein BDF20DRAFT_908219 [Mycotypha africana]|uniref:uncharacterized protein n=1 Tax=Mycotypha africana TaxID=64632 RepID=UPI0022FFE700|nr:uncharacterized protein BDF20DRAFT_908219 [Mycotypha africana]KAI8967942.1 hypothetical protein BDF20DRAFT_908219 [Mycotypha africana]